MMEKPISNQRHCFKTTHKFPEVFNWRIPSHDDSEALFLNLDIDGPHAFPRHAEIAVKWKHTSSVFTAALFCILCPSEELKKKKKRFMTHCFQGCCSPCSFPSCFWIRFSPCLFSPCLKAQCFYTAH